MIILIERLKYKFVENFCPLHHLRSECLCRPVVNFASVCESYGTVYDVEGFVLAVEEDVTFGYFVEA